MHGTTNKPRQVAIDCLPITTDRDNGQRLIVPLVAGATSADGSSWIPRSLSTALSDCLPASDSLGSVGARVELYSNSGSHPQRFLFLGLGEQGLLTADRVREAAAELGRICIDRSSVDVVIDGFMSENPKRMLQAFAEGFLLGLWEKDVDARTSPTPETMRLALLASDHHDTEEIQTVANRGHYIAKAIQLARDVSNAPASSLTPSLFEKLAAAVADSSGLQFSALTQREIESARLSGLMAVTKGSIECPAFVTLEHKPNHAMPGQPIVLIGKGVTFDSGGLTLKSGAGLPRMKHDKAGAGVILAVMSALAKLEVPRHVIALLPVVENMPSGTASRPGDVLTMANDRTVEIISTDAEGRLILVDALLFAKRFEPRLIIDIATLCGATRVALGREAAAIFSNSDSLRQQLMRAGESADETLWPLPLLSGYLDDLRSPFADLRNSALAKDKGGGACVAAAFLNEFASADWAHIDIAGVAWDNGSRKYYPREGASGFGVRLLLEFLANDIVSSSTDRETRVEAMET